MVKYIAHRQNKLTALGAQIERLNDKDMPKELLEH